GLAALALAVTGCRDPYERDQAAHPSRSVPAAAPTAQPAGDTQRPGPTAPAPPTTPATPRATAHAAATAFARAWTNWDWRTAAAHQRALARLAVGRLAAQLRASAGDTAADASLARDRPSS